MFKKIIGIIVCAILAVAILAGCAATTETPNTSGTPEPEVTPTSADSPAPLTLVLDWTPNTNHTGLYAALELGYYKDAGIDLEIVQPPEDGALTLVAADRADFGISFQEEVLIAANAEPPLPVVAIASVVEHNTGGIMSMTEAGITRFSDMEGKSFASWQIPIYDEIVRESIIADGGNPDNVEFVPNSGIDPISGMKYEYDAVWVYEGWEKIIADLNGVDTNFLLLKDINPVFDYYTPVIICNQSTLDNRIDMVKSFLAATEKGYTYAKENPAEAAEILIKYAPETDADIIHASQEYLSGQYFSSKWGFIDEVRWNAFFDWLKEKELVDAGASSVGFVNIER